MLVACSAVLALSIVAVGPVIGAARAESSVPAEVNALPVVSWLIANVSSQRIYQLLYDLQNFSTRYVATTNVNDSAAYIVRDYSNNSNLIVQSQYFVWNAMLLRNVIAVLPAFNPANKTAYVIGGHYDSITIGETPGPMTWAPGVDDDGSGTVAAMEVARVLSPYRFNATLIFAAWSAEEVGLVGSDVHAASLRNAGQDVGAVIGMDMIGNYVSTMGLDLVHDGLSEWIADALIRANTDYGIGLQLTKYYRLTANSDHASFWAYNYNAIMAAETDFSPNWHKNTDTIDNVNITLITKATQVGAAALAELAGIIPPGYGSVIFEKEAFKPGDLAAMRLYDSDLNTNPGTPDTAMVAVYSDTDPAGESAVMTETGANTGIFQGSVELVTVPPGLGQLRVNDGDQLRAEYLDADPPGTRVAYARVDAVLPRISNVHALPDIDWAGIKWDTDEPADSTVFYGETPALGLQASRSEMTTSHSVLLTGLRPGTLYFYDVQSADVAGNVATADNGGSHFRFVTLYGSTYYPENGYVGYVKSNQPALNYFTGPEILVGQGFQGTYLGAAQLDTSANPIPPTAAITRASFIALGKEWIYEESSGQWNLRLLNLSIDAGWTTAGYAAINGASVDATVPPTFINGDLSPATWDFFEFQAGQFDLLRTRVNTGKISFRFDGPRGPAHTLFSWYTGNGFRNLAPRLRIAYSLTGDTSGPLVTRLLATPNPTMASPSTVIDVTMSDATTGGNNISFAEYFMGADPGLGLGVPLMPIDNGYDSQTEDFTISLDVSSLPRGAYSIGFRGRDQADNWGQVSTLVLYVGVWDMYPPALDSLTFNPPTPESSSAVNISVRITDDIAVYGAWAYLTDPSGNPIGNFSMAYDPIQSRYYHDASFSPLGTYRAGIWANDTSNKWNSTSGTFDVVDTTRPVIVQTSAVPSPQNYDMTVTFTAWVVDKFLDSVHVAFRDPLGMPAGNFTALRNGPGDDNYSYMTGFSDVGQWTYCFSARDTSNLWAVSCGSSTIGDGYPPAFILVEATPSVQRYGQSVSIRAWVIDPYISSVSANVTGPSGLVGNFSMTRTIPFQDNWTFAQSYGGIGFYDFTVWAYDASGNHASSSGTFTIVDMTSPVFDSVQATPNPAEIFDTVRISARVTDVQAVTVKAEVKDPTNSILGNFSMSFNAGTGAFEFDVAAQMLGTYRFALWATDASNNKASAQGTFLVRDMTKPAVTLVKSEVVNLAEESNDINVTVRVKDNYALLSGGIMIEWTDAVGGTVGNWTMTAINATDFYYVARLTTAGQNRFTVTALDTSYNAGVILGQMIVVLGQPPVAVAGEDQNITVGTKLELNGSASSDDFPPMVDYVWRIVGPNLDETLHGAMTNYSFTSPGDYNVTLTVYDSAGHSGQDTFKVHVSSAASPPPQNAVDPIVIMATILIVIILIAMLMLLLARKRKKETPAETETVEEEGEQKD